MKNISEIIGKAIEELNIQQPIGSKLENILQEKINSENSKLDSLGLLMFINILEELIVQEGIEIDLMAILMEGDPDGVLTTVDSLLKFLEEKRGH